MALRDLIPWHREETRPGLRRDDHPLASLHREMNRLFDDFFGERRLAPGFGEGGAFLPSIDVHETDGVLEVTAELPGLAEEDVDVSLTDDTLTLRGEKKREETKKDENGYTHVERSYGSFHRAIPLPPGVDGDRADATFKNGVLTVKLPKNPEVAGPVRKIQVKTGG
ncbi:MAG: Hsp20/alpha crystallin family protein [Planctomycetota bacterium]